MVVVMLMKVDTNFYRNPFTHSVAARRRSRRRDDSLLQFGGCRFIRSACDLPVASEG